MSRTPLENKRRQIRALLQRQLDVFGNPPPSADAIDLAIENIADLGMKDKEHCGMVRSMFIETTGLPWCRLPRTAAWLDSGPTRPAGAVSSLTNASTLQVSAALAARDDRH